MGTSPNCRDARPPFAWESDDEWMPNSAETPILRTYAVEPYTGPVYMYGWTGECQEVWDSQSGEFAVVTAELSADHWVEMTTLVE